MSFRALKKSIKKMKGAVKMGCVSVALITAWNAGSGEANADPYYFNINRGNQTNINTGATVPVHITGSFRPTLDITNAYLITDQYLSGAATSSFSYNTSVFSLGNLQAGRTLPINFNDYNRSNSTNMNYTIVGLYNNSDSAVVGIAGTPIGGWNDLFSYSENNLVSAINSADPGYQLSYFMFIGEIVKGNWAGFGSMVNHGTLSNNLMGTRLTAYGFSDAIPVGTMIVQTGEPANTPVPEPATLLLMLPGLAIGYLMLRRKKDGV